MTTQRRSEHLLNRVAWRILHYVGQNFILRFLFISHPIFNMNYLSIISIVHYLYDSFSALFVQYIYRLHVSSYIILESRSGVRKYIAIPGTYTAKYGRGSYILDVVCDKVCFKTCDFLWFIGWYKISKITPLISHKAKSCPTKSQKAKSYLRMSWFGSFWVTSVWRKPSSHKLLSVIFKT